MSDQGRLFPRMAPHRNATAVERTIKVLRGTERLEGADAALIATVRSTARALDAAPNPYVTATVARVHLEGIRLLTGRPAPEPDEIDRFLDSLRTPTLGNPTQP